MNKEMWLCELVLKAKMFVKNINMGHLISKDKD